MTEKTDRRCFLARSVLGATGMGAAYKSLEERSLADAIESGNARTTPSSVPKTDIPPGSLPCGKIGNVSVSRLLIGGNLIGGWAHSRDLMYMSKLFTSYNTEAKVFETLELAQECGINTIQLDPACWSVLTKYNQNRTVPIQTMICVPLVEDRTTMREEIQRQIDLGATLVYSHGGVTDSFMMNGGSIDAIGQMLDLIKAAGCPGWRRRPLAEHADRVRGTSACSRFLRQDVPWGSVLVGHA